MAKVKTISVTYGRKFNLGNYESAEVSQTIWADLEEGEEPQAALDDTWKLAKDNVAVQSENVRKIRDDNLGKK